MKSKRKNYSEGSEAFAFGMARNDGESEDTNSQISSNFKKQRNKGYCNRFPNICHNILIENQ